MRLLKADHIGGTVELLAHTRMEKAHLPPIEYASEAHAKTINELDALGRMDVYSAYLPLKE